MNPLTDSSRSVRVVLVDDSMICRHQLREILSVDGRIDVVGEGCRGEETMSLLERHQPDLLVVDLVMPGQGGQETIALVMARHPLPILVVTAQPEGVRQTAVFDAIRRGALELAEKPRRGDREAEERLRRSVRMLAQIPVVRHVAGNVPPVPAQRLVSAVARSGDCPVRAREAQPGSDPPTRQERAATAAATGAVPRSDRPWSELSPQMGERGAAVVGIGASAGGPTPLASLLGSLTKDFSAPIAVVQHLPVGFTDAFADYLRGRIVLTVKKVERRETMRPGVVYLACDDHHLVTTGETDIAVSRAAPCEGHRPAVDALFEAIARTHGRRSVGIILSGIGQDGVRGMLSMREQGALTLAQSEETCAVFGMPQAAIQLGAAREAMSPEAMAIEVRRCFEPHAGHRVAR